MDYFKELLDSYSKLKKRTFKLQYINEQEEVEGRGDPAAAKAFFDAADPERDPAKFDAALQNKQPYAYKKAAPKEGGIGKTSVTGGPLGTGYTKEAGSWEELLKVDPKGATKLINFFDQQSVDGAMTEIQQQEEEARIKRDTPGSMVNASPERFPPPQKETYPTEEEQRNSLAGIAMTEALRKGEAAVIKLCKDGIFTQINNSLVQIDKFKGCPQPSEEGGPNVWGKGTAGQTSSRFVGGDQIQSLEYKLINGQTASIDYKGDVEFRAGTINQETLAEVAENNTWLLDFMALNPEGDEKDCEGASRRIRPTTGGRVILFGADDAYGPFAQGERPLPSTGVAINPGPLQKAMLQRIKESCPGVDMGSVSPPGTNTENAKKGTFNEDFLGWLYETNESMKRAEGDWRLERVTEREQTLALQSLVAQKQGILKNLAAKIDPDVAIDMDDLPAINEIMKQLEDLGTNESIRRFLKSLTEKNKAILKLSRAQTTLGVGTGQSTGGKVDNYLVYGKNKDDADWFAEVLDPGQGAVTQKPASQLVRESKDPATTIKKLAQAGYVDPTNNPEPVFMLAFGQKLTEGDKIKLGQTFMARILDVLEGTLINKTPGTGQDYKDTLDGLQFPPGEADSAARLSARQAYGKARNDEFKNIQQSFTHGHTSYTTLTNTISTMTATQAATHIQTQFGAAFAVNETNIITAEFTETLPNGRKQKRDLADERVRIRTMGATQRARLFTKLKSDINEEGSDAQAAKDTIVGMGIQTAMNLDDKGLEELMQMVVREGEGDSTIYFNQNDFCRGLSEAARSVNDDGTPALSINIVGGTATLEFDITVGNRTVPISYTVSAERASGSKRKDGTKGPSHPSIIGKISESSAEGLQSPEIVREQLKVDPMTQSASRQPQGIIPAPGTPNLELAGTDLMYNYLKGQHQLLEDLLNQTK
tara:strand:+ start:1620 stop:4421 length:2802 start_codon:yes stop_codon:yes gene_type:complete